MLEERGRADERGGDGFEGGLGLFGRGVEAGQVLEGEKGAEAGGERRSFACEGVAEGEYGWVGWSRGIEDRHGGCRLLVG